MKNICIDPNRLALKIHTGIKQEASANFHKNPRIILNIDAILYFLSAYLLSIGARKPEFVRLIFL